MGLVEKNYLISQLVPPLDQALVTQLVDEFISAERRFIQRDWEPAELDGGQFCEILSRIIYHQDSGNLSPNKEFGDCMKYIENEQVPHLINPRSDAIHMGKVLRIIYKFRSDRGAVHISNNYSPNHMDAKLVIENVRWCMNETLRIFWNGDRDKVAKVIRELLQFDVPAIGIFEDIIRVQRTDLTSEEEILILLHFAGEGGFTRNELGRYSKFAASSVTRALQKLTLPEVLEVIKLQGERYRLTDLGSKRIRTQLADKLLIQ
jgi:hypothetical protein